MRKLQLDVEHLQVEPFVVDPVIIDPFEAEPAFGSGVGSYTEPYRYCLRQPETASCYC